VKDDLVGVGYWAPAEIELEGWLRPSRSTHEVQITNEPGGGEFKFSTDKQNWQNTLDVTFDAKGSAQTFYLKATVASQEKDDAVILVKGSDLGKKKATNVDVKIEIDNAGFIVNHGTTTGKTTGTVSIKPVDKLSEFTVYLTNKQGDTDVLFNGKKELKLTLKPGAQAGADWEETFEISTDKATTVSTTIDDAVIQAKVNPKKDAFLAEGKATAIKMDYIKAVVNPTPPKTLRPDILPEDELVPKDQEFRSYKLTDVLDESFLIGRTLVMIEESATPLPLRCIWEGPADLPLKWDVARAEDDHESLGTGVPTLSPTATGANLGTAETGSFFVYAYVDANQNGERDADEPKLVLDYVLVRVQVIAHDTRASVEELHVYYDEDPFIGVPSMWVEFGPKGDPPLGKPEDPNLAPVRFKATLDLFSGGPNGRRALGAVKGGWVQNIVASGLTFTGTYEGGHVTYTRLGSNVPQDSTFFLFPEEPYVDENNNGKWDPPEPLTDNDGNGVWDAGEDYTDSNGNGQWDAGEPLTDLNGNGHWDPADSTPEPISLPIIDAEDWKHGDAYGNSWQTSEDLTVGERRVVEGTDMPHWLFPLDHPGYPGNALTGMEVRYDFSTYLCIDGWASHLYSVAAEVDWTLEASWAVDAAAKTATLTEASSIIQRTYTYPIPVRAEETALETWGPGPISTPKTLITDARY